MNKIKYLIIGLILGWLTVGMISARYLQSDVNIIINLLERIADNTEALR